MNESSRFRELLNRNLSGICTLSDTQIQQLHSHYQLLSRWNKTLNLTAIRDLETAVLRHYCESLFLGVSLPSRNLSVADLGSGAGFPGIPMAVLRPDCRFTLIESHKRKAVFLREGTRGYPNVQVAALRAEQVEISFDWLVSRAVPWQDVLERVPELAPRVALLLGAGDAIKLLKTKGIAWRPTVTLPWGKRRKLVMGEYVPRET